MWIRSRNCLGSWMGLRGQGIGQVLQLYPILFSEYIWGVSLPCVLILRDITAGSRKATRPRQDSPCCGCWASRGATVQCAIANGWVSGLTNLQNLSPSHQPVATNSKQFNFIPSYPALQLVAVQDKYWVWTTVHFWTSLQPQQEMFLSDPSPIIGNACH